MDSCLKLNEASRTWKSILNHSQGWCSIFNIFTHLVSICSAHSSWSRLRSPPKKTCLFHSPPQIYHHPKGINSKRIKMINRIQKSPMLRNCMHVNCREKAEQTAVSSKLTKSEIFYLGTQKRKTDRKQGVHWLSSSLNSPYHSGSHGVHLEPSWGTRYDATPFIIDDILCIDVSHTTLKLICGMWLWGHVHSTPAE